jgi:hypothetical protein
VSDFEIESGVPVSTVETRGRPKLYPFEKLKPGESMFVPGVYSKIRPVVAYARRVKGLNLVCRKAEKNGEKGARVWLVEF